MLKTLLDLLHLNCIVSFKPNGLFVDVNIEKTVRNKIYTKTSTLPFDHLYEEKLVECLTWMSDEIHKEHENA